MWSNAASHNSADPDGSLIAANASLLRLKIFPVQRFRELAPNIRRIFGLSGPADQPRGLKMAKFPVSSLTNREFRGKPLNRQPETGSLETGPSANCTDRHIFRPLANRLVSSAFVHVSLGHYAVGLATLETPAAKGAAGNSWFLFLEFGR